METRKWIVAGVITGTLALVLLAVLVTLAFAVSHPPIAKLMVLSVADILLGITSLKLFGDYANMRRMDSCYHRYVEGVGDTVDRLASVLPQKDNVRRIG